MEEKVISIEQGKQKKGEVKDIAENIGTLIVDDAWYFDDVFSICSDLILRSDLVKQSFPFVKDNNKGNLTRRKITEKDAADAKRKVSRITKQIIKKEKIFWERVEKEKGGGKKFIIENDDYLGSNEHF